MNFEKNFEDIHPPLRIEEALIESNRCINCFDAPCTQACPTHIDVPRFIKQIGSKNLKGSARTILEANPMGHSCARVCPVESLCEGACVFNHLEAPPIKIALLQRVATDAYYSQAKPIFEAGAPTGKKTAVIGAGPAGLSCAGYLARLGHTVTVFDKKPLGGGLNTYGIAEYKMTQATALEEVKNVQALGVQVRQCEVGKDIPLAKLEKDFDAVFIGAGLGATHRLNIPGEELPGVMDALAFIEKIKTRKFQEIKMGDAVAVIGAGNTAVDAATQAKRLGAQKVLMVYRRGPEEMPAYDYEQELAKQDAIEFVFWAAPLRIEGKSKTEKLICAKTRLTPRHSGESRNPDSGLDPGLRRGDEKRNASGGSLETIPGSEFSIPVTAVIKATGQEPQKSWLSKISGLQLNDKGWIEVNPKTMQTSNPKYFAGGDAINGGKEVVNAAADGKRAAWAIHQKLTGSSRIPEGHEYWISTIEGREVAPPRHTHTPKPELVAA